nr:hypothetical protein CFP56_05626 [Quercus suber]
MTQEVMPKDLAYPITHSPFSLQISLPPPANPELPIAYLSILSFSQLTGGKKAWKKFKGCVSLLHHSTSILKTKRKRAHRAFAQVVCKLLGWDFHRIPNIVFKPQPQPLQLQGGPEGIADDSKDDSDDVKKDNAAASVNGPGWPCPQEPPPETSSSWHSMKKPVSTLQPLSAEDQASQMQYKALQPCREFLLARNEDEDKTSEDGNSEEDEEELRFFLKLFSEDRELRSYYEKCYESGDFYCLVCCGTGKTVWKKFKGCVGLLQHSTSILKTKRKHAHRAFAQVICKVLGWDLHRLPARLGSSSASHYCVGLLQLQVNAVSVAASSGEVAAASVNGIEQLENSTSVITVSNGEKAFSINGNSNSGENMVSVDGDHSDAIDKEGF